VSLLREYHDSEAAVARQAVPTRTLRHIHAAPDPWALVLYQFAAEPYSVIAMAAGPPRRRPANLHVCRRPLDRDGVATTLDPLRAGMASWLDRHLVSAQSDAGGKIRYSTPGAPQLIVPGKGTITALDDLAYSWRYTPSMPAEWQDLGWELWALLPAAAEPGAGLVIRLDETLPEHWAFGLSTLEEANVAVDTALLDATAAGLTPAGLLAAESIHAGPLGDPDRIDNPVWKAMTAPSPATAKGTWRAVETDVRAALLDGWQATVAAWSHLCALPEAPSALDRYEAAGAGWARRVFPKRSGDPNAYRRRAVPTLSRAGRDLAHLEAARDRYEAQVADDDPLAAAESVAIGRGIHGTLLRVTATTPAPRRQAVALDLASDQLLAPSHDTLIGRAGIIAVVLDVAGVPGAWTIRLGVDRIGLPGTAGVQAARRLTPGDEVWLHPPARSGPPPPPDPPRAPSTHPNALT
jgi:hypothetical protein